MRLDVERAPGETAVNGQRPPMALEMVHLSPEANILIVEVPVVAGKENPIITALWKHIPYWGQEVEDPDIKINAMDLIPADRGFYRFPGSLTAPVCSEPVQWYVLKNPIEMSQDQIDQYRKYYHGEAASAAQRPAALFTANTYDRMNDFAHATQWYERTMRPERMFWVSSWAT